MSRGLNPCKLYNDGDYYNHQIKMRWVAFVDRTRKKIHTYTILVVTAEEGGHLEDLGVDGRTIGNIY
jgi:hypothetical protein